MEIFNKLTNEEADVEKLNQVLKEETLNFENKTFIKGMIEKKLTEANELEGKLNRNECKDTNAGAFHIVIANQIAHMDEGFIVDVTRDAEVWNQAVQGFDVKEIETKEPSAGSAEGTVKEVVVEQKCTTLLKYITIGIKVRAKPNNNKDIVINLNSIKRIKL